MAEPPHGEAWRRLVDRTAGSVAEAELARLSKEQLRDVMKEHSIGAVDAARAEVHWSIERARSPQRQQAGSRHLSPVLTPRAPEPSQLSWMRSQSPRASRRRALSPQAGLSLDWSVAAASSPSRRASGPLDHTRLCDPNSMYRLRDPRKQRRRQGPEEALSPVAEALKGRGGEVASPVAKTRGGIVPLQTSVEGSPPPQGRRRQPQRPTHIFADAESPVRSRTPVRQGAVGTAEWLSTAGQPERATALGAWSVQAGHRSRATSLFDPPAAPSPERLARMRGMAAHGAVPCGGPAATSGRRHYSPTSPHISNLVRGVGERADSPIRASGVRTGSPFAARAEPPPPSPTGIRVRPSATSLVGGCCSPTGGYVLRPRGYALRRT